MQMLILNAGAADFRVLSHSKWRTNSFVQGLKIYKPFAPLFRVLIHQVEVLTGIIVRNPIGFPIPGAE
jgi:hypothetical protein